MLKSFKKVLKGYQAFRKKYAHGNGSIMRSLSLHGQQPKVMVIACCDSRVDPAVILQCDPGDLFVVRNVANIVPPYEKDATHHGTSAALEFGVSFLKVKHLILLGHSQCGGIQALLDESTASPNDFISSWVSIIKKDHLTHLRPDDFAKEALHQSHQNCLEFPWIREKVSQNLLKIHLWYFDIKAGEIFTYSEADQTYMPLEKQKLNELLRANTK